MLKKIAIATLALFLGSAQASVDKSVLKGEMRELLTLVELVKNQDQDAILDMIQQRKEAILAGDQALDAKAELQDYISLVNAIKVADYEAAIDALENRKNFLMEQNQEALGNKAVLKQEMENLIKMIQLVKIENHDAVLNMIQDRKDDILNGASAIDA